MKGRSREKWRETFADSASFLFLSPVYTREIITLVPSSIHPSVSQISTQFKNSRPFFYFLPPCRYGFMLHCPRNPSKRARNERNIRLPFVSRVVATSTLISLSILVTIDGATISIYKFHKDMVAEAWCSLLRTISCDLTISLNASFP